MRIQLIIFLFSRTPYFTYDLNAVKREGRIAAVAAVLSFPSLEASKIRLLRVEGEQTSR